MAWSFPRHFFLCARLEKVCYSLRHTQQQQHTQAKRRTPSDIYRDPPPCESHGLKLIFNVNDKSFSALNSVCAGFFFFRRDEIQEQSSSSLSQALGDTQRKLAFCSQLIVYPCQSVVTCPRRPFSTFPHICHHPKPTSRVGKSYLFRWLSHFVFIRFCNGHK